MLLETIIPQHAAMDDFEVTHSLGRRTMLLKAKAVASDESRQPLRDAHERVMSVAAVQSHLHASEGIERIAVGAYLTGLCRSLAASMISGSHPPVLEVVADDGKIGSAEAVSLGLIVPNW